MDRDTLDKLVAEIKAIMERPEFEDYLVEILMVSPDDVFAVMGNACRACMLEEFTNYCLTKNIQHDNKNKQVH